MENIYKEALGLIKDGAKFSVSLEQRHFKLGRKYIIRNGKFKGELGVPKMPIADVLSKVEEFYAAYKHSVPSERSERARRMYFRALRIDDLSDDDMLFGLPRELARAQLELFLLCCIVNGSLTWDAEFFGDHWFWQSENDKWLVIRKGMIEPTPRKGAVA